MLCDNLHFTVMKPGLMAFLTSHMIRSAMNAETAFYVGTPTSMIANTHDICQGSLVSPVSKDRDFMKVILVFLFLSMYSYCSSMYSYRCLCIFIVVYVFLDAATLTEVFPCFSLGCKANAWV
jgi:hypothetical protein